MRCRVDGTQPLQIQPLDEPQVEAAPRREDFAQKSAPTLRKNRNLPAVHEMKAVRQWALRCKVAARRGVYSFDVSHRRSKDVADGSLIGGRHTLKKSTTVERET